ncbi:hypothetical protein [Stenotrophomonas chelatiphaga]|uniref:hypothetical protein n=1 Tax=Stenotrophomonas chelatiphaga TaxID=517011 RepID=UPI00289D1929|nr:hypothetical protein [Stenotrophomonas chelatiphaga]
MQVDTFGAYVRAELEHWGREFALHRDLDYLGHHSKNVLQVLIEHKGDMPGRAQGYKPLELDQRAQRIETIIFEISRYNVQRACVLRAFYCGQGRKGVERWETANLLLANCSKKVLSRPKYYAEHEVGFAEVRGFLTGLARAA